MVQFVPVVVAVVGAVWAIFSYLLTQRRTLALERTKFIFEQSKFFETDPSMRTANKILYGLSPDFTVETFLRVMKSKNGTTEEIENAMIFDNYLNFLWRVAYSHLNLKTLKILDLDAFGYYFEKVLDHTDLRNYCKDHGFEEIVQAAEKLKVSVWDVDSAVQPLPLVMRLVDPKRWTRRHLPRDEAPQPLRETLREASPGEGGSHPPRP